MSHHDSVGGAGPSGPAPSPRRRRSRWNTDAGYPDDGDALNESSVPYSVINWFVRRWRRWRGQPS